MRGRNWGAYLEVAHGAVEANQLGRLEQFAAIQYKFAGDPKHALEIFKRQLRDTDTKGARGFMFGAQRQISDMLIRMGDLAQAEAYLRRNLSLIQEARTSSLPGWRSSYAVVLVQSIRAFEPWLDSRCI